MIEGKRNRSNEIKKSRNATAPCDFRLTLSYSSSTHIDYAPRRLRQYIAYHRHHHRPRMVIFKQSRILCIILKKKRKKLLLETERKRKRKISSFIKN